MFLNFAAMVSSVLAIYFGSLATLSPETVQKLGEKLQEYLKSKPSGFFSGFAHTVATKTESDYAGVPGFFKAMGVCATAAAVAILSVILAKFMTALVVLGVSIWGLKIAVSHPDLHPILLSYLWIFSMIGLFYGMGGLCLLLITKEFREGRFKVFSNVIINILELLDLIFLPLEKMVICLTLLFTMAVPLSWYRNLKIIHARGIPWLCGVAAFAFGLLTVVLGYAGQLP
jgi:hypothetical protein